MGPLHLCISLGPLGLYLLLLGSLSLLRRPVVTTGSRDTAALGIGISGFFVAGPMELFLPEAAANKFGPFVWIFLLAFYGLSLTLLVLLLRPRLIIYNTNVDQLRPILAEVVGDLDSEARWVGDCLVLPGLGVQLHLEPLAMMRVAQLIAAGPRQNYSGWRRLEQHLAAKLKTQRSGVNPHGIALVVSALLILNLLAFQLITRHEQVVQALDEMLRR